MVYYAVSACLAGICCRYDGGHGRRDDIYALWCAGEALALCPEVLGGLATPRPLCEIVGSRVLTRTGEDCTAAYERGAHEAVRQALLCGCRVAVVQSRSPSCGVGRVYDGSFSRCLVTGEGLWVRALRAAGIRVVDAGQVPLLPRIDSTGR